MRLLTAMPRDGRGRLKIFLGAAPGVGKTFEMLTAAHGRRREGIDVVVGIVETHGRAETVALVEGLEVVPGRQVHYRGRTVDEMDLDAVLARRPRLVLVDELAHTNAPGSRHPKRYLDVEELLAAGIDVYTTLNIQHVESLNDVVAGITRIRVRETVPDSIIDRADDIEVIDLTPQDLIQRLNDGKVYVPHQAERAVKHYFQPGNLAALRELALRRTAQRVDDQMVDYMRSNAISGPWGASERVLVHVDGEPGSAALVRQARRIADGLRGPWTALHVEGGSWREQARQAGTADALRLAERLGGETVTVPGADPARPWSSTRAPQLHPHRRGAVAPRALDRAVRGLDGAARDQPRRRHPRPRPGRGAAGRASDAARRARPLRALPAPSAWAAACSRWRPRWAWRCCCDRCWA